MKNWIHNSTISSFTEKYNKIDLNYLLFKVITLTELKYHKTIHCVVLNLEPKLIE